MCGDQSKELFPRSVNRYLLCALVLLLGASPAVATDGYYDTTFGSGGRRLFLPSPTDVSAQGMRLHILADGTLLLGGTCDVGVGTSLYTMCLAWLQPDGTDLNHNYGPGGSGNSAPSPGFELQLADMAVIPDGRLALLGNFTLTGGYKECAIVMVWADGTALDTTVGGGFGYFTLDGGPCNRILVQNDGKILLAGGYHVAASASTDMAVGRVLADLSGFDPLFNGGSFQTVGFDLGGGNSDVAYAIALQPDGRIVIAGSAQTATGSEPAFARLLADGKVDNAVNDPVDPFGPSVHDGRIHLVYSGYAGVNAIALDRAGNIVFVGAFKPLPRRPPAQKWQRHRPRVQQRLGPGIPDRADQPVRI